MYKKTLEHQTDKKQLVIGDINAMLNQLIKEISVGTKIDITSLQAIFNIDRITAASMISTLQAGGFIVPCEYEVTNLVNNYSELPNFYDSLSYPKSQVLNPIINVDKLINDGIAYDKNQDETVEQPYYNKTKYYPITPTDCFNDFKSDVPTYNQYAKLNTEELSTEELNKTIASNTASVNTNSNGIDNDLNYSSNANYNEYNDCLVDENQQSMFDGFYLQDGEQDSEEECLNEECLNGEEDFNKTQNLQTNMYGEYIENQILSKHKIEQDNATDNQKEFKAPNDEVAFERALYNNLKDDNLEPNLSSERDCHDTYEPSIKYLGGCVPLLDVDAMIKPYFFNNQNKTIEELVEPALFMAIIEGDISLLRLQDALGLGFLKANRLLMLLQKNGYVENGENSFHKIAKVDLDFFKTLFSNSILLSN